MPQKKLQSKRAASGTWLPRWLPFYTFLNALDHYVDVDCFLVPLQDPEYWMCVHRAGRNMANVDLAYWVSTAEQRRNFDQENLKRLGSTGKPFAARLAGFTNLLIPVFEKGRVQGALVVGPFADHEFSARELKQVWLAAEGRYDAAYRDDYHYFCRVLLEIPLLQGNTLEHFQEFSELFAAAVGGDGDFEAINARMEEIFYGVLTKSFYHDSWAERIIHEDRYFLSNWRGGAVTEWERRELGISFIPERILAFVPSLENVHDPVEAKRLALRFQRVALQFSAKRQDVAVGCLGDHGVLLFHAPQPSKQNESKSAQILARDFQHFIEKRLKCRTFCGMGAQETKDRLYHSYLGAVDALHHATEKGERLVISSEKTRLKDNLGDLAADAHKLTAALLLGRRDESSSYLKHFVSLAQRLCGDRLEALRVHFLYLGQTFLQEAERQGRAEASVVRDLSRHWSELLEAPSHPGDLIRALDTCLAETTSTLEHPATGGRELRFLRARKWVEENYYRDPSLSEVAKAHGFSASALCRELKRSMGLTYSGWLNQLRLAQVQEILFNTQLSVSAVAASAGFDCVSYFFQWFKRQTGATPSAWRRQRQRTVEGE